MKKLLNSLKYGNSKTKFYIISVLLLLILGGVSLVFAITKTSPLWGMAAAFFFILAILMMNSVSFKGPIELKNIEVTTHNKKKKDIEDAVDTRKFHEKSKKEEIEEADEEENAEYLEKYSEDKVTKLFSYYKVKKNHVIVMIDYCASERIRQCPAYMWIENKSLNFLLLEKEPRKVVIPSEKVKSVNYEKGVLAFPESDYETFQRPSFVSFVFNGLLPSVYEDSKSGKTIYRKNLYVISPDIKVTNTSAKVVLDLLQMELKLPEEEEYNRRYSPYFTAAYVLNIKLKDGVISVKDYKTNIKTVLQQLAEADISMEDFKIYINQLVLGRVVTKEYADYYIEVRNKKK